MTTQLLKPIMCAYCHEKEAVQNLEWDCDPTEAFVCEDCYHDVMEDKHSWVDPEYIPNYRNPENKGK